MSNTPSLKDKNILALRNVFKTYKQGLTEISVLENITVDFTQGTSYAIQGVSGTGKSTIIHLLAGLDTPTRGQVLYNDQEIHESSALSQEQYLLHSIGLIFQFPYLIKELSILENIMVKGLIKNTSYKQSLERAKELLDLVGLSPKQDRSPAVLSGGEQQRVALARALFIEPTFLLADEPTAHLDEQTRDSILQLLLDIQKKHDVGLIIASHDPFITQHMNHILQLQDKHLIMVK